MAHYFPKAIEENEELRKALAEEFEEDYNDLDPTLPPQLHHAVKRKSAELIKRLEANYEEKRALVPLRHVEGGIRAMFMEAVRRLEARLAAENCCDAIEQLEAYGNQADVRHMRASSLPRAANNVEKAKSELIIVYY